MVMPLLAPDACLYLAQYAVCDAEADIALLYYEGDTEQRIAQVYALSRHRVKEILRSLMDRLETNTLPLEAGTRVCWRGLNGVYEGVVARGLTLIERYTNLGVRAEIQDKDWYWITTDRGEVAKLGEQLEVLA